MFCHILIIESSTTAQRRADQYDELQKCRGMLPTTATEAVEQGARGGQVAGIVGHGVSSEQCEAHYAAIMADDTMQMWEEAQAGKPSLFSHNPFLDVGPHADHVLAHVGGVGRVGGVEEYQQQVE